MVSLRACLFAACLLPVLLLTGFVRADDVDRHVRNQEIQDRIAALIEALGSDEYTSRERAQTELARLGAAAFDDLLVARNHPDVEIAQRAQYLVERIGIDLVREDDPRKVQQILSDYASLSDDERVSRMHLLAHLEDWQGVPALCRVVRFDDVEHLSKQAALRLLQQSPPETTERREELAETIESTIDSSNRPAADWVRAYAETLRDPVLSLSEWERIVGREWNKYERDPRQNERLVLLGLLRWQVDLLAENGRPEEAEAAMVRTVALLEPVAPKLLEAIDWFLEREAWSVIDMIYERFGEVCGQNAQLTYRLAEIRLKQGREEEAQQLAQAALGIDPENLQNHDLIALRLQRRGLLDWAEKEYRYVMENSELTSLDHLRARLYLSEMLHDMLLDGEAAQVLQPAVDALRDRAVEAMLRTKEGRGSAGVTARMHFFYAMHFGEMGDLEKKIEHLDLAITIDPFELDVIIALYRLPDQDEARQKRTQQYLEETKQRRWREVAMLEDRISREGVEGRREPYFPYLAAACNQYAWLVSNTEGDYQQALECSQKSLELVPDSAGYLDTLARCHYALGEYENAVHFQRQAVELLPHSGQIRRQLEEFERALREQEDSPE